MAAMSDSINELVDRVIFFVREIRDLEKKYDKDKAEMYDKAKAENLDKSIIKDLVAIDRKDPNKYKKRRDVLDIYLTKMGRNPAIHGYRHPHGASEPNETTEDLVSWKSTGGLGE
jgi:uncharacterized protein (UPF0335 family)